MRGLPGGSSVQRCFLEYGLFTQVAVSSFCFKIQTTHNDTVVCGCVKMLGFLELSFSIAFFGGQGLIAESVLSWN